MIEFALVDGQCARHSVLWHQVHEQTFERAAREIDRQRFAFFPL